MLNERFQEQADKLIREHGLGNPLSAKYAQAIGKEEDLKELLRWMKRTVTGQVNTQATAAAATTIPKVACTHSNALTTVAKAQPFAWASA
jgi:hypothetical protein